MKKLNKKGFTLIELLAVIIILGVLMIIAVPSVTEYISSSRKSTYIDTAYGYIDAVRTKVNSADKLQFYDVNTLYLVPVGNTDDVCVAVEKGGKSPFSDTWRYAYVGVTYTGKNYNYYFVANDGSNQGINFTSDDMMDREGGNLVKSGTSELAWYPYLSEAYGTTVKTDLTPGLLAENAATDSNPDANGPLVISKAEQAQFGLKGKVFLSPTADNTHFGFEVDETGSITGPDGYEGNNLYLAVKDNVWDTPENADSIPDFGIVDSGNPADFAEYVEYHEGKNIDYILVVPADLC